MNIDWLQDFITLSRVRNFTRASKARFVAQSAFSRRIRALEDWVGVELIDRDSKPLQLTAEGKTFLPVAQQCVLQLLTVQQELKNTGTLTKNFVRIASPQYASTQILTEILQQLSGQGVETRTQTMSENLQTCCQLFQERQCDFLVCYNHPNFFPPFDPSAYEQVNLAQEIFLPVCAPTGGKGFGWMLPGGAQDIIPYLAYPPECALGLILGGLSDIKEAFLHVAHFNALSEALKALTLAGAGVAWLPQTLVAHELQTRDLIHAGGKRWNLTIDLTLYYNPTLSNPSAQQLWEHLQVMLKAD